MINKAPTKHQCGSVLIFVLVFSLLMSMIVTFSLESSVLQAKISRTYQYEVINFINTEQTLRKEEVDMMEKGYQPQKTAHPKVQFIADTLIFGERQGLKFYELDINQSGTEETRTHLQSVISLR
jgi:Tfp pilus assembly protein PilX